ncbi:MAG: Fic/DOC family N-terminal domain-containing protein [Patescibacteria group bacterium]
MNKNIQPSRPPKLPAILNPKIFFNELADAENTLGLLEGLQNSLQNPGLLIAPLSAKEATVSSKIEGTQSTASDVFIYEASGVERKVDTAEVANYRKAILYAIEELSSKKPFSLHLIKRLHQQLLTGVRHKGAIGQFRNKQVYIAEKQSDPIEKAIYIPPIHLLLVDYMENYLNYLNTSSDRTLVQMAVSHYQFEAVHPFEDGNGRIGRLLIPLLLFHKSKLTLPIIYMSGYFEENRDQYISALHLVDTQGAYDKWIAFFCRAVASQTKETIQLINRINKLHEEVMQKVGNLKSPYIYKVVDAIFKYPVFTKSRIVQETKATYLTASKLIDVLKSHGYVNELSYRDGRNKLFVFGHLLSIIR